MLMLSIILLVIASALLLIALRGRIAHRGSFCRRCRFNLHGLADDASACPECGADLAAPKATRPTLRRRRPVVLILAIALLLCGTALMDVVVSNNTARLMGYMPDRVVLILHGLGMDAAFTEIATNRLTQANPLSKDTWDGLIADAVLHQQDLITTWDPRHGEVLAQAFMTGRLSTEQIEQYFALGFENAAQFPDVIRHGAEELGVSVVNSSSGRISALSVSHGSLTDTVDTVWKRFDITTAGVIEPEYETPLDTAAWTGVNIPSASGGGGRGSTGVIIPLNGVDWDAIEPGTDYEFFVEYSVSIARMSDNYVHYRFQNRATQPIRILPDDAQLIALDTDPQLIAQFQNRPTLLLSPLRIVPKAERQVIKDKPRAFQLGTMAVNLPIAVIGEVIVIHEGQEFRIGEVSMTTLGGHLISGIDQTATAGADDDTLQQWLDAGHVTIEIRPDPRLAEQSPDTNRILGVPLRFEDVPVTREDISDTYRIGTTLHPRHTAGRPVTEPTSDPDPVDPQPEDTP